MPGSVDANLLADMLRHSDRCYRLLNAQDWAEKALDGSLGDRDMCLTFDDGLASQFEIALPALQAADRTAFWFCSGAPLDGAPIASDIHKYFIATNFDSFDDFFDAFVEQSQQTRWRQAVAKTIALPAARNYLNEWTFYSEADRIYRYIRDICPGTMCCGEIIDTMMRSMACSPREFADRLWLKPANLRLLEAHGHVIGLHSYSHPMRLDLLEPEVQAKEYGRNLEVLSSILSARPISMSHPCNAFTPAIFDILEDHGIKIGFRGDMDQPLTPNLDHCRVDQIYFLEEMQK